MFRPTLIAIWSLLLTHPALAQQAPEPAERYQQWFAQNAVEVEAIDDMAPLFAALGERRFALLGESTHGTREYYQWRADLSRHLIAEKGFAFVGVEGDWQNIQRLNDYVKHRTDEGVSARDIMLAMDRWPQWMWANEEFEAFVEWLREHNEPLEPDQRAGLYGLDMQDPEDSMAAVKAWFAEHDPDNRARVAEAYEALLDFPEGLRGYARQLAQGGERLDEQARLAVELLREHRGETALAQTAQADWSAKQNALAAKRAEAQFHDMVRGHQADSWNQRASHMHEAFLRIADRYGEDSRGIGWAHNTHMGDARATAMRAQGQVNIGQLLRESEGEDAVLILGFTTHSGEVVAARQWDGQREVMAIRPAQAGSAEALLHEAGLEQALLVFDPPVRSDEYMHPLEHRAIGVVYQPPNEGYVPTLLPWRYDALLYIDETHPLTPLHNGD